MSRSKKRRLGQNFLVDGDVAERIVGLLDDQPSRVLEIGPGRGALTEVLRGRFEMVVALELDEYLAKALAAQYREHDVEVVHADALHDPLDPLLKGEGPWQVASNLPYSVGTAILRRLMPRHDLFEQAGGDAATRGGAAHRGRARRSQPWSLGPRARCVGATRGSPSTFRRGPSGPGQR